MDIELILEIIVAALVVTILILIIILQLRSRQKSKGDDTSTQSESPVVEETPITPAEIKEVVQVEESPVVENKIEDVKDRRKCDTIIKKRSVPEHGKITKQHFTEFAGERILIAEDNPINQKVLLGLLSESGIELVMANDGQEALDILEADSNFLMILMDAHMPRVDGFQATRIIRENPKYDHILVVALSGDTASDDIQKMKDAGMSEQLAKPLRMEALYDVIYAYTGKEKPHDDSVRRKSFDPEKGLQTCSGDEEFYREILREFIMDYGTSSDTLGRFLRSNNLRAADALLLDIIGVAENIGAHPLGEIATHLKLALHDTDEQSYFILFDEYNVYLSKLVQDIQHYL